MLHKNHPHPVGEGSENHNQHRAFMSTVSSLLRWRHLAYCYHSTTGNQVARSGQRRITSATQKSRPPTSSPTNDMPLEAVVGVIVADQLTHATQFTQPPLPSVHPSPQHHWGYTSSYRVPRTENDFFESEDAPIQWPDGPLGSPHNGHPPTRSTTIGYQLTDAGPTYSFPGPLQTPAAGSAIPSAPNSTAVAVNVATDEIVSVPARVEGMY